MGGRRLFCSDFYSEYHVIFCLIYLPFAFQVKNLPFSRSHPVGTRDGIVMRDEGLGAASLCSRAAPSSQGLLGREFLERRLPHCKFQRPRALHRLRSSSTLRNHHHSPDTPTEHTPRQDTLTMGGLNLEVFKVLTPHSPLPASQTQ